MRSDDMYMEIGVSASWVPKQGNLDLYNSGQLYGWGVELRC